MFIYDVIVVGVVVKGGLRYWKVKHFYGAEFNVENIFNLDMKHGCSITMLPVYFLFDSKQCADFQTYLVPNEEPNSNVHNGAASVTKKLL